MGENTRGRNIFIKGNLNCFLAVFFSLTAGISLAQAKGKMNPKNLISVNGLFNIPFFYNFLAQDYDEASSYKLKNGQLKPGYNFFNSGFTAGITRYSSSKFGYGVEFSLNYSKSKTPRVGKIQIINFFGETQNVTVAVLHEMLNLSTITVMPKIEYSNSRSMLPHGFHHELGVGYSQTSIVNKDYVARIENYSSGDNFEIAEANFDSKKIFNPNLKTHGITLLYGFNGRVPINNYLIFNYGIRYTLNFMFVGGKNKSSNSSQANEIYYMEDRAIQRQIQSNRLFSIATLNVGLNFAF